MPSAWNMFVKKIYHEGKKKDPNYEFKQALVDASKRKGEMGKSSSSSPSMDTQTPSSKRSRHRNRKHTKSSKKSHTKSFLSSLISGGRRRRTRRH